MVLRDPTAGSRVQRRTGLLWRCAGFLGTDIDRVDRSSIELRLWWSVEMPPGLDYSIGLHLLNAEGPLVAQQDSALIDFYTGDFIQTSQLVPDHLYIDQRDISLPPDLPLSDYQSWDNQRLTLPDSLDDLTLDNITVSD